MFAQLKPMNLRTSNFERRLPCWWPSYSKPRARAPPIGFVFISIFFSFFFLQVFQFRLTVKTRLPPNDSGVQGISSLSGPVRDLATYVR